MKTNRLRAAFLVLFASYALAVLDSRADDGWTGRWEVMLHGSLESVCIANVAREGADVTGDLVCPELGIKLPIKGSVAGVTASSDNPRFRWTAAGDLDGAVGTYESDGGGGSWTAIRASRE